MRQHSHKARFGVVRPYAVLRDCICHSCFKVVTVAKEDVVRVGKPNMQNIQWSNDTVEEVKIEYIEILGLAHSFPYFIIDIINHRVRYLEFLRLHHIHRSHFLHNQHLHHNHQHQNHPLHQRCRKHRHHY